MRCLADPKHSIINLKAMCGTGSRHTRQIWKKCARSASATHECSTRNAPTISEPSPPRPPPRPPISILSPSPPRPRPHFRPVSSRLRLHLHLDRHNLLHHLLASIPLHRPRASHSSRAPSSQNVYGTLSQHKNILDPSRGHKLQKFSTWSSATRFHVEFGHHADGRQNFIRPPRGLVADSHVESGELGKFRPAQAILQV